MKTLFLLPLLLGLVLACNGQSLNAHEIFQDVLKEKYGLRSFACKTCHPDGDDRTIRTVFADLIADEMKDGNWTEKFKEAEAKGEDAVKAFELLIADEFRKCVDDFGKRSLTVDQLMESGLLTGVRLEPQKKNVDVENGGFAQMSLTSLYCIIATLGSCLWLVQRFSFK